MKLLVVQVVLMVVAFVLTMALVQHLSYRMGTKVGFHTGVRCIRDNTIYLGEDGEIIAADDIIEELNKAGML